MEKGVCRQLLDWLIEQIEILAMLHRGGQLHGELIIE